MNCSRCNFKLDPIDIRANVCPVCEKTIDPRRRGEDQRQKFRKDERLKKPQ